MRNTLSTTWLAIIFAVIAQHQARAAVVDNTDLASPGFYNGTGAVNGGFTVDTENGIEAGLRASIRTVGPITPVGNLYSAPLGLDSLGTHALWNFDYSVNPGDTLGTYAQITIKNLGTLATVSYLDTPTVRGNAPGQLGDATNGNGYQNSENLNFAFLSGPLGFNANSPGTYEITLDVFSADSLELAAVTIDVAAVPEPSTWAMMILGFCGLGIFAYCRRRETSAFLAA